jgi:hypothetical protein
MFPKTFRLNENLPQNHQHHTLEPDIIDIGMAMSIAHAISWAGVAT